VVATTLRSLGVDAEARLPVRRPAGEIFDGLPDVRTPGLGVHVVASPVPWARAANYLNRAEVDAADRGQGDVPALIRPAPAEAPENAYVVLRLSDFARLALDAARSREAVQTAGEG
jgi:hypothetical protein